MQIGDKVRFLNDVGGGTITGFQGKNIVLVQDEDGFDIPVMRDEVVVITTNEYNFERQPAPSTGGDKKANSPSLGGGRGEACTPSTAGSRGEAERKDGDRLNVTLAFVPANSRELSKTTFECYLVNDCNYYISYIYMSRENAVYQLRSQGVIEPNTKLYIEDIDHSMLNDIERVSVQLVAFKQNKPFALKQAVSTDFRIDTTKFYKLHTFRESLFFDEPALEYPIVKDDVPVRPLVISADELKRAMYEKQDNGQRTTDNGRRATDARMHSALSKPNQRPELIEVDLHAAELLDTTAGLTPADIKDYQLKVFRETMNQHLKDKGCRIVFIHGKGEGVLRQAIIQELKHSYKSCTYQDASFQQYGFGATMVIVH